MIALPRMFIVDERELRDGHTLYAVSSQKGKRPTKHDTLQVYCSCGARLSVSIPDQARQAIVGADVSHRLFGDKIGFAELDAWHGTPNGYVNHDCRCDPCVWAYESYRRGDDPWTPAPTWLDSWLETAAAP